MGFRLTSFHYFLAFIPLLGGPQAGFVAVSGQYDSAAHPVQHRTQTHLGDAVAGVTERQPGLSAATYAQTQWIDNRERPLLEGAQGHFHLYPGRAEERGWEAVQPGTAVAKERRSAVGSAGSLASPSPSRAKTKAARRERFWAAQVILGAVVASVFNVWLLAQACAVILVGGLGALTFGDLMIAFVATIWQWDIFEHRGVLDVAWRILTGRAGADAAVSAEASPQQDEELREAIQQAQLGMRFVTALHSMALEEKDAERALAVAAAQKLESAKNLRDQTAAPTSGASRTGAEVLGAGDSVAEENDLAPDSDPPDTLNNEADSETLTAAQDLI